MIKLIKVRYSDDPGMLNKKIPGMTSESLAAGLRFWGAEFRPLHFEMGAYQRYGYAKRQVRTEKGRSGYSMRKMKVKHHNRPLVYSGDSERELQQIEISTYTNRAYAYAKLKAPKHFFIRNPITLDKADELTRVIPQEEMEITEAITQDFGRRIDTARNAREVTLRAS